MSCGCGPRGNILPPRQDGTTLLHEHQLRHHSFQRAGADIMTPGYCSPESMQLTSQFEYYKQPVGEFGSRSPMPPPPICWDWTAMDVGEWLKTIGYGRYRKLFCDLQINGKKLVEIGDAHGYRRLGIRNFDDCVGIAAAAQCVIARKTNPDPHDFKYNYQSPSLLFGQQTSGVSDAEMIHKTQRFHNNPERDAVLRHIYRTSGDRYYYFDSNKQCPTI